MTPALSVLQLDTQFPRIPGDVAAPQTYRAPIEILRVSGAGVPSVVRDDPDRMDITPFSTAMGKVRGAVITTSCGFLSYWQDHLQAQVGRPVIASALTGLPRLARTYGPEALMIVTFDAMSLGPAHLQGQTGYAGSVVGLPPGGILQRAIAGDMPFDVAAAEQEVVATVHAHLTGRTRAILLECTNLPPYVAALRRDTGCAIYSILTEIERLKPGLVAPDFL